MRIHERGSNRSAPSAFELAMFVHLKMASDPFDE